MHLRQWQERLQELWSDSQLQESDIVTFQAAVMADPDVAIADKGRLLMGTINHPGATPGSKADQIAMLGGLFENEKLPSFHEAPRLVEEINTLLRG